MQQENYPTVAFRHSENNIIVSGDIQYWQLMRLILKPQTPGVLQLWLCEILSFHLKHHLYFLSPSGCREKFENETKKLKKQKPKK